MNAVKSTLGLILIIAGILFFIFLRMLNDPEVEGESGRISFSTYFLSLIQIIIGMIILFLKKRSN